MDDQLVLPLRPQPLEDELCSSWLLRLATECGTTLYAFRRVIAPRLRLPIYDFDRSVGVQQLASIAKATLTDQSVVRQSLLRFHRDDIDDGSWLEQWLLPVGGDDGSGKPQGYQYCPQCLSEGIPYFRRWWRFSFVVVCTRHARQLSDQCGRCGASIHATSIGLAGLERMLTPGGEPPFVRCAACGWDLRDPGAFDPADAKDAVVQQQAVESIVQGTHARKLNGREYLSLLYRSTEVFAKEAGTVPFEYLRTRHRAAVLERAYWLLSKDRWRYIQNVCSSPRVPLDTGGSSRQTRPRSSSVLIDARPTGISGNRSQWRETDHTDPD